MILNLWFSPELKKVIIINWFTVENQQVLLAQKRIFFTLFISLIFCDFIIHIVLFPIMAGVSRRRKCKQIVQAFDMHFLIVLYYRSQE